ncbi:hypothetical protein [Shimia sp. MMG029]|uniref:hypothetical protein n=1 Tax=Shimia sp. MMG029 TaxID=3021978 RepID=UPI0022FF12F2|nr:hypothetical protein [Shimia sp. MMG029]MDA5558025.1 hypothetical protein [Shimia sp. MMG029]
MVQMDFFHCRRMHFCAVAIPKPFLGSVTLFFAKVVTELITPARFVGHGTAAAALLCTPQTESAQGDAGFGPITNSPARASSWIDFGAFTAIFFLFLWGFAKKPLKPTPHAHLGQARKYTSLFAPTPRQFPNRR